MEENNLQNQEQLSEQESGVETVSVVEAMSGVFYDPNGTFESIKKVKKNYWVIPLVFMVVINLIASFIVMRDNEVMDKIMGKQKQKMIENMQKSVKEGKMTQEQANQAIEQTAKFMDPKSPFFIAIGLISGLIMPFMMLVILAVVGLLGVKILKGTAEFSKLLNVTGISLTIVMAGSVITTFLTIFTGDIFSLSLAMLFKSSGVNAFVEALTGKIDIIYIWFIFVLGVGFSKIGNVKQGAMVVVVFTVYIIFSLLTSLPSLIF